jgi:hypothetical protein
MNLPKPITRSRPAPAAGQDISAEKVRGSRQERKIASIRCKEKRLPEKWRRSCFFLKTGDGLPKPAWLAQVGV